MSLPRLPFLYPPLLRTRPSPRLRALFRHLQDGQTRRITAKRHGTAVEPSQLQPPQVGSPKKDPTREGASEKAPPPSEKTSDDPKPAASDGSATAVEGVQQPTLAPRQYVHHFDTYTLVRRLCAGGFGDEQSIAVMKGIRDLLSRNMETARASLVSKSDVENQTYLFQAACSELRNEVQNARKTQVDALRSERTRIQQEFDTCNQQFLGEMMTLKDELNGMFNDRKMVTRAEQRTMENKIQELNYKITILINSDLKSEIEKLRWITTRRGLTAIALLAVFVISSLKISANEHEEHKKNNKKKPREEEEPGGPRVDPHSARVLEVGSGASAESFVSLG